MKDYYKILSDYFDATGNDARRDELEKIKGSKSKVVSMYNRFKSMLNEDDELVESYDEFINEGNSLPTDVKKAIDDLRNVWNEYVEEMHFAKRKSDKEIDKKRKDILDMLENQLSK